MASFPRKRFDVKGADGDHYNSVLKPKDNDKLDLLEVISGKSIIEGGIFSYQRLRFFADFLLQIEFDYVEYKGFCRTLKFKRDQIAHGERSFVNNVSDCVAWHEPTLRLLDEVRDSVLAKAAES